MKRSGEAVYLIESKNGSPDEILNHLVSSHFEVQSFERAADYINCTRCDDCACLITDIEMKDMSGLDLLRELNPLQSPPIIFISACASAQMTVAAMKAGAFEFLIEPFSVDELREAVEAALEKDRVLRRRRSLRARLAQRFSTLTPRQQEVFPLIIGGLLNKQAAALLNISEVTLQIHRTQIMRKMQANSFAELVRMAVELRIPHWQQLQRDEGLRGLLTRVENASKAFSRRQFKAGGPQGTHFASEVA